MSGHGVRPSGAHALSCWSARSDVLVRHYRDVNSDWQSLLEATDWSGLSHAYGNAAETPDHIRALVSSDPDERMNAVEHLWAAVLHQGTIYPVTPFVARILALMLPDDRLAARARSVFDSDDADGVPVHDSILMFFHALAESASCAPTDEDSATTVLAGADAERARQIRAGHWSDGDFSDPAFNGIYEALLTEAVSQCVADASTYLRSARSFLLAPLQSTRSCAIATCAEVAKLVEPSERRELEEAFRRAADTRVDDRLGLVLALSAMDADTSDYLRSDDLSVRFAAALSDGIPRAPALDVLIESLRHYTELDALFDRFTESFRGWPRFAFVQQACRQAPHFDALAAVAPLVAQHPGHPESDWGHLLDLAFPEKWSDDAALTKAQRDYLSALVESEDLWDPAGGGNRTLAFMRVGLPSDRDALQLLIDRSS